MGGWFDPSSESLTGVYPRGRRVSGGKDPHRSDRYLGVVTGGYSSVLDDTWGSADTVVRVHLRTHCVCCECVCQYVDVRVCSCVGGVVYLTRGTVTETVCNGHSGTPTVWKVTMDCLLRCAG